MKPVAAAVSRFQSQTIEGHHNDENNNKEYCTVHNVVCIAAQAGKQTINQSINQSIKQIYFNIICVFCYLAYSLGLLLPRVGD